MICRRKASLTLVSRDSSEHVLPMLTSQTGPTWMQANTHCQARGQRRRGLPSGPCLVDDVDNRVVVCRIQGLKGNTVVSRRRKTHSDPREITRRGGLTRELSLQPIHHNSSVQTSLNLKKKNPQWNDLVMLVSILLTVSAFTFPWARHETDMFNSADWTKLWITGKVTLVSRMICSLVQ